MAYSTEVRQKAMEYCQYGLSDDKVSEKMGVSKQTLSNWKKQLFTTGSLDKKKVKRASGKPYKYTPDAIGKLLAKSKTPDTSTSSTPKSKGNKTDTPKPKKKKKKMKF